MSKRNCRVGASRLKVEVKEVKDPQGNICSGGCDIRSVIGNPAEYCAVKNCNYKN